MRYRIYYCVNLLILFKAKAAVVADAIQQMKAEIDAKIAVEKEQLKKQQEDQKKGMWSIKELPVTKEAKDKIKISSGFGYQSHKRL